MIVVTIDPSLSNTCLTAIKYENGEAIVIDSVTIHTEKSKNKKIRASSDLIERCVDLYRGSYQFVDKWSPNVIFAETPSGSQSASSLKSYAVSCFLLASLPERCLEVTPAEVKKASVGKATASKEEMIEWAFEKHPEAPWLIRNGAPLKKQEHLADSIAVFYAGMKTKEFEWLSKAYK